MNHDQAELTPPEANETAPLKKFAPDEMLTCDACLRANAPTRARCLYCGATLAGAVNTTAAQPQELSQTPTSSDVHYIVIRGGAETSIADSVVTSLAGRWQLKMPDVQAALSSASPLPLLCASNQDQADQFVSELAGLGIQSLSIKDLDLKTSVESRKIHTLEFADAGLTGIAKSPGRRLFSTWDDPALIVTGRLHTNRVEADERQGRAGSKPLDRRELTTDESVLDIYARSPEPPWRIFMTDFDFSCLKERKGLTAFDNFKELIRMLSECSSAEVADGYVSVRPQLAKFWPLTTTTTRNRSQRIRARSKDVSIVTTTDNENQFNTYSRLLWLMKMHEMEANR
jgi:hypothetical protein